MEEAGEGRASGGGAPSVSRTSRDFAAIWSTGREAVHGVSHRGVSMRPARRGGGGFRIGGFPADDVHVHGGDQSVRRVRRVGQGGGAVRADDGRGGAVAPTGITRVAMLSAYEKCERWERAVAFLSRLNARADAEAAAEKDRTGVDPRDPRASGWNSGAVDAEELHFNIAMSACGKCGEWREADRLFREMLARGVTPTSVTYSTLIAAYGRAGKEARANRRFREMIERGLKPDDYTVVGLLLAPANRGDYATCVETKEETRRKHGVKATVHVYNELIEPRASVNATRQPWRRTRRWCARGWNRTPRAQELLADVGKKGRGVLRRSTAGGELRVTRRGARRRRGDDGGKMVTRRRRGERERMFERETRCGCSMRASERARARGED